MPCLPPALLIWLLLSLSVGAHPNPQNAMWVQFEPSCIRVALDVSLQELAAAQGMKVKEGAPLDAAELLPAAEAHRAYLLQHLNVSIGTLALSGSVLTVSPPAKTVDPERTFYQYELEYPFSAPPPYEVRFYHDMLKEWPYAPGIPWEVGYIVRTKRSDSDTVSSWLLSSQKNTDLLTGWGNVEGPPLQKGAEQSPEDSFLKKLWQAFLRFFQP